jgi:hypothetical protein
MEGRGEKEFKGAMEVIWARISSKAGGWKTWRSLRSVMRRVFDGGVGWDSEGMLAMSIDREGRVVSELVLSAGEKAIVIVCV